MSDNVKGKGHPAGCAAQSRRPTARRRTFLRRKKSKQAVTDRQSRHRPYKKVFFGKGSNVPSGIKRETGGNLENALARHRQGLGRPPQRGSCGFGYADSASTFLSTAEQGIRCYLISSWLKGAVLLFRQTVSLPSTPKQKLVEMQFCFKGIAKYHVQCICNIKQMF